MAAIQIDVVEPLTAPVPHNADARHKRLEGSDHFRGEVVHDDHPGEHLFA